MVGSPYLIAVAVASAFDGVGVPICRLVQRRAGHRPEKPWADHLVCGEARIRSAAVAVFSDMGGPASPERGTHRPSPDAGPGIAVAWRDSGFPHARRAASSSGRRECATRWRQNQTPPIPACRSSPGRTRRGWGENQNDNGRARHLSSDGPQQLADALYSSTIAEGAGVGGEATAPRSRLAGSVFARAVATA